MAELLVFPDAGMAFFQGDDDPLAPRPAPPIEDVGPGGFTCCPRCASTPPSQQCSSCPRRAYRREAKQRAELEQALGSAGITHFGSTSTPSKPRRPRRRFIRRRTA